MNFNAYFSIPLLCAALMGCNSDLPPASNEQMKGLWYSPLYGEIKQISVNDVQTWQVTSNICFQSITQDPFDLMRNHSVRLGDTLIYHRPYDTAPVSYTRIQNLDEICTGGLIRTIDDPDYQFNAQEVFRIFWLDMKEHYAFLKERKMDWEEIDENYYDDLSNQNEAGLLAVFSEILKQLNDGHTRLYFDLEQEPISYEAKPHLSVLLMQEAIEDGLIGEQIDGYIQNQRKKIIENISLYMNAQTRTGYIQRAKNQNLGVNWGIVEYDRNSTGYLSIDHFVNYIDSSGIEKEDISYANEKFNVLLDEIFENLNETEQLIIDVRDNEGGYDLQALELIKRFLKDEQLVWDISTAFEGKLWPSNLVYAKPERDRRYQGDVILLTSNGTFSAGETFALAMAALPQVRILGEATGGATSDTFLRMLPNGWLYEMSNEYYQNSDSVNAEVTGVLPDIDVHPYERSSREAGLDSALEKAFEVIQNNQ
ncbi:S41 family peptidase [Photobacterium sp. 1_MG-2023]|uniref:S41 family peptidase n=1 Tax=Photobacterium sp. 1_MG-2023 TaxID=3062646 RepID=UPI0026E2659C|nr:S41 family peptidase [Photobacterium sp. 1_MG-2023]MDO6707572.1 S41 family peptidase [Photobacterium sp. 1_MG-2023]